MENLVHPALLLSAPSAIAEAKKNTTMTAEGEVVEAGYLIIFLLKTLLLLGLVGTDNLCENKSTVV